MQTKFEIIETPDYILAVSDEVLRDVRPYKGKYHLEDETTINIFPNYLTDLFACKLIVGYQPKNNAPELDLPLLSENDVEKLAHDYLNKNYEYVWDDGDVKTFVAGYKAATKRFSEEDLRNIAKELASECLCIDGEISSPSQAFNWVEKKIQSLKQATPKWFVAEYKTEYTEDGLDYQSDELKTTKINGKTYLVGTYKYE